jgi:hypothetical protein
MYLFYPALASRRQCGFTALRLYGFTALRLYGFTALRLYGKLIDPSGIVVKNMCRFAVGGLVTA